MKYIVTVNKLGLYRQDIEVEADSEESAKQKVLSGYDKNIVHENKKHPMQQEIVSVCPKFNVDADGFISYNIPFGEIPNETIFGEPINLSELFARVEQCEKMSINAILIWCGKAKDKDLKFLFEYLKMKGIE